MAICSAMLSASLVERQFIYSNPCSARVLFAVVIFVTAARSSAVACAILTNDMEISMALLAVTVLYPIGGRSIVVHAGRPALQ